MTVGWGLCTFPTAVGVCGVAWGPRGLVGVELPAATEGETIARCVRRLEEVVETNGALALALDRSGSASAGRDHAPAHVGDAIDAMTRLLAGDAVDLAFVEIDLEGTPPFARRVYAATRALGPGATVTYGELAERVGSPGAQRAVGGALGRNPWPIVVPCHRVLAARGAIGGFSAPGGVDTKRRMLAIEGAAIAGELSLFDRQRPAK